MECLFSNVDVYSSLQRVPLAYEEPVSLKNTDWSRLKSRKEKKKKASDSVLGLTLHFSRSQPQRVKFSYSLAYLINLNKEIAKNSGKPFRSKVNSIHFNKILLKICLHIFIYAFNKYFLNAYELSTVLGTVNKATGKIEPANQLNK